jgi:hypothetical protein
MKNQNKPKDFQVAILIEDVAEAKEISDGLRDIGIFAHYYSDLDELWVSLNSYTPDLCIVDVKKMSQGTLLFKQHQKVKNNSLKYAFYYKDTTQMLLRSTYGLNHYGLIRGELDLNDQLKSVLRRRNEELRLVEQNDTLNKRVERLKLRGVRLTEQQEKNHFSLSQTEVLDGLTRQFGVVDTYDEFIARTIHTFSEWESCFDFGIYKLNGTNQKLVSPKARKLKYRNLPDLWLSAPCDNGINNYAIEMAYDVCYGLMDEELSALRIFGINDNPDILIIGKFDQTKTQQFNWSGLETKLNSEYRRTLARTNTEVEKKHHEDSLFDTFQALDDVQFHKAETKHRTAIVDFSGLVSMIKQKHGNRFYWKAFAKEFTAELTDILSGDYRLSNYGVECFIVGIDKQYIETDFHKLKAFVGDFQFWRYFEDSSLIVSHDLSPELRFVAPSSVNIIRQVQDGFGDIMQKTIQTPERQIEV